MEPAGQTVVDQVEQWLLDGYIDGVVRLYQRKNSSMAHEVEDAVATAIRRIIHVARRRDLDEIPKGYLHAAVRNALTDAARRLVADGELNDDDVVDERLPEHGVFGRQALELVRGRLDRWPNRKMAVVTMAYVEAAYYNEPLVPEDVQELVADTLGEHVSVTNVSTLWNRGRTRLIEQVRDLL